jgi:hypothetical protein
MRPTGINGNNGGLKVATATDSIGPSVFGSADASTIPIPHRKPGLLDAIVRDSVEPPRYDASPTPTRPDGSASAASSKTFPEPDPPTRQGGLNSHEKTTVDAFIKLGPDELMKLVRDGGIPDEVLNSREGMLRLQSRLEEVAQMNNLLSQMLNTMHQMNMAVIQNLRA